MGIKLSFLCTFAAVIQAVAYSQTNDPRDLLAQVRGNVVSSLERLPKYMCSLTIDRAQYAPPARHAPSCDGLLGQQSTGQFRPRLAEADRLRLDVAIAAGSEIYSWAGEDRFDDRDLSDLVRQGALQTGGFSTFLSSIFRGTAASFSYDGDIEVDGRMLAEFGFQVPLEKSHYVYGNRSEHVTTGYEGTFLANPKTGDLVRLLIRTSHLSADSGACQATTTLDYGRMRLHDAEFLLPREAHLDILLTDGSEWRNRTAYSSCHEFVGESTVKFDESVPEASPATVGRAVQAKLSTPPAVAIPVGRAFKLVFTQPIDTEAAAGGDRIKAKLKSAIRDISSKVVLIAEGSEVNARIVRLEHFPGPPSTVRMLVKLETVNIGGMPLPFMATIVQSGVDETNQRGHGQPVPPGSESVGVRLPPSRVLQRPMQLGSLDTLDVSGVGVFEFRDAKANFVVKAGLESNWITSAP